MIAFIRKTTTGYRVTMGPLAKDCFTLGAARNCAVMTWGAIEVCVIEGENR